MLKWIDRLPWTWLLLLAAWLAIAPITPEPHLVEKLRMLSQGTLVPPARHLRFVDACNAAAGGADQAVATVAQGPALRGQAGAVFAPGA